MEPTHEILFAQKHGRQILESLRRAGYRTKYGTVISYRGGDIVKIFLDSAQRTTEDGLTRAQSAREIIKGAADIGSPQFSVVCGKFSASTWYSGQSRVTTGRLPRARQPQGIEFV